MEKLPRVTYLEKKSSLGMEGALDNKMETPRRKLSNSADAIGLWFAALVLCAVFAAGVIVYQTGNSDIATAENETAAAGPGNAH